MWIGCVSYFPHKCLAIETFQLYYIFMYSASVFDLYNLLTFIFFLYDIVNSLHMNKNMQFINNIHEFKIDLTQFPLANFALNNHI